MSAVLDGDALRQLAVRLVAISELLEQRSEHAVQRVDASAAQLEHASRLMGVNGEKITQDLVDALRQQGATAIRQGVGGAIAQCLTTFKTAEAEAARAAAEWSVQRRQLASSQRRVLWGSATALIVGSLLSVGGSAWVVREHVRQLKQVQFGEDLLAATRTGAITRCGENLCVRAAKTPVRYGASGEYVVVKQ